MSKYDLSGVKPRHETVGPLSVSFDASATIAGVYDEIPVTEASR
jgi:hypothetical protein